MAQIQDYKIIMMTSLPETIDTPFGGRYEGVKGMTTYKCQLAENWEIGGLDNSEVIISDGGKRFAAISVERDGKALATGRSCDMAFVWIFKMNDAGQFIYVREYNDTNAIGQTFL